MAVRLPSRGTSALAGALIAGLALPLLLAPALSAAPAIDRGWPTAAPYPLLHKGANGGPVVTGNPPATPDFYGAVGFSRTGSKLWSVLESPLCGNCRGRDGLEQARPDGTIGPIGYAQESPFSVDAKGKVIAGACVGIALADGTCIATEQRGDFTDPWPAIVAKRGSTTLWSYEAQDHVLPDDFSYPPRMVRDRRAITYVGLEPRSASGIGGARDLIALNPDGTLRWISPGAGSPVAALATGVIASDRTSVAAYNTDGTQRWTRPQTGLESTHVDVRRRRAYLNTKRNRVTVAIDLATGKRPWSTSGELSSVGANGTLYVLRNSAKGYSVNAISPARKLLWRHRTASPTTNALDMRRGRVAVTTKDGLLTLVNTKRKMPRDRRSRVGLNPADIRLGVGEQLADDKYGAVLTMQFPRKATVVVRYLRPDGKPIQQVRRSKFRIPVPAGTSHRRILAEDAFAIPPGRYVVALNWRDFGRPQGLRIPFSIKKK